MSAVEKRISRLQEGYPSVDYSYYNTKTENYIESSISKWEIIAELKLIDIDKALVLQRGEGPKGVLFSHDDKEALTNLIKNVERDKISKFEIIDKPYRRIYKLHFENEPECLAYHIIAGSDTDE